MFTIIIIIIIHLKIFTWLGWALKVSLVVDQKRMHIHTYGSNNVMKLAEHRLHW